MDVVRIQRVTSNKLSSNGRRTIQERPCAWSPMYLVRIKVDIRDARTTTTVHQVPIAKYCQKTRKPIYRGTKGTLKCAASTVYQICVRVSVKAWTLETLWKSLCKIENERATKHTFTRGPMCFNWMWNLFPAKTKRLTESTSSSTLHTNKLTIICMVR